MVVRVGVGRVVGGRVSFRFARSLGSFGRLASLSLGSVWLGCCSRAQARGLELRGMPGQSFLGFAFQPFKSLGRMSDDGHRGLDFDGGSSLVNAKRVLPWLNSSREHCLDRRLKLVNL